MAQIDAKKTSRKRKAQEEEEDPETEETFPKALGGLEIASDDDGEDVKSDDGEVDEFPEIDTRSDSEDADADGDESELDDEDVDEEDDEDEALEEEEEEDSETDVEEDEIQAWPKPKTVISDITGQPKRVYPEIEPDYDSDSSTEDVRQAQLSPLYWF